MALVSVNQAALAAVRHRTLVAVTILPLGNNSNACAHVRTSACMSGAQERAHAMVIQLFTRYYLRGTTEQLPSHMDTC
jgi:hypothetical protein